MGKSCQAPKRRGIKAKEETIEVVAKALTVSLSQKIDSLGGGPMTAGVHFSHFLSFYWALFSDLESH